MEKSFICSLCDKQFTTKQSLITHLLSKSKKSTDVELLEEIDEAINSLKSKSVKNITYCNICQVQFSTKYTYNKHYEKKHLEHIQKKIQPFEFVYANKILENKFNSVQKSYKLVDDIITSNELKGCLEIIDTIFIKNRHPDYIPFYINSNKIYFFDRKKGWLNDDDHMKKILYEIITQCIFHYQDVLTKDIIGSNLYKELNHNPVKWNRYQNDFLNDDNADDILFDLFIRHIVTCTSGKNQYNDNEIDIGYNKNWMSELQYYIKYNKRLVCK
jgi:hypothetical protein